MTYESSDTPTSPEESLTSSRAPQERATVLIAWALQWTLASKTPEGLEPAAALIRSDFELDLEDFPIPWIQYAEHGGSLAQSEVEPRPRRLEQLRDEPSRYRPIEHFDVSTSEVAATFLESRTLTTAAALARQSALDHDPLIRVAGALASLIFFRTGRRGFLELVRMGATDPDPNIRETALAALTIVDPRSVELVERSDSYPDPDELNTSLLIHGTFAGDLNWWRPGEDFHSHLIANAAPDLYSGNNPPSWNGGYTNEARALGAGEIMSWAADHDTFRMNKVLCHSHGGSVAMLASRSGLHMDQLVLLSCPARERKYLPDFARVRDTISIRVRLDRILLLDMIRYPDTRARFSHPAIREHTIPIWFDHAATTKPQSWIDHRIASLL